jgi:hypothetical protein
MRLRRDECDRATLPNLNNTPRINGLHEFFPSSCVDYFPPMRGPCQHDSHARLIVSYHGAWRRHNTSPDFALRSLERTGKKSRLSKRLRNSGTQRSLYISSVSFRRPFSTDNEIKDQTATLKARHNLSMNTFTRIYDGLTVRSWRSG